MENSNINFSKVCGLCAGCKRAVDTAIESTKKHENVTLFKQIVHNKNVNDRLTQLGIKIKDDINDISQDDFVILRAHGEPPETYRILNSKNIQFADCTCVNVKKIHDIARKESALGKTIILLGKYGKHTGKMHPEVAGILGNISSRPILIEDEEDLEKLTTSFDEKFALICQTTFNGKLADKIIEKAKHITKVNGATLDVFRTICLAQQNINKFSEELAKSSDIIIVVGGKNSSNSIELFENVKKITKSIFIEDINYWETELKKNNIPFDKSTRFGITAGASTMQDELIALKKLIEQTLGETNENKN